MKELDEYFVSLPLEQKRAIVSSLSRTYTAFKPADFVPPVRLLRNGALQCNRLLEREALINNICRTWAFGSTPQKTQVVSLIASNGMGKTALLEYLADPSRIPHLKPPQLLRAGKCGRILCVYAPDFEHFNPHLLWPLAISQHCATIFDQCSVGGIEFFAADLHTLSSPNTALILSTSMRTWLAWILDGPVDYAFEELKRLTSLAFGEKQEGEVIALVDECQAWANTLVPNGKHPLYQAVTAVPTWVRIGIGGLSHNQLDVLSNKGAYTCVCTEDELTSLSRDSALELAGESPIAPIVVALSRVPRILRLVQDVQEQSPGATPRVLLENWRHSVHTHYQASLSTFTVEEASWIIAATTCRWIVPHFVQVQEVCVPGTKLPWRLLQAGSFISRNMEGQISLIFGTMHNCPEEWMADLRVKFFELFGVTLDHAVFDYARWIESNNTGEGASTLVKDSWEHLVTSALVLRYHLLSKQIEAITGAKPVGLPLSTVYECDEKSYPGNVLSSFDVCLEKAVYGGSEVFASSSSLAPGLYSNKEIVATSHNAIISCVKPPGASLAVQCRFESAKEALEQEGKICLPQLKKSKNNATADCGLLLEVCPSIDEAAFKEQAGQLVQISGRGCMNEEVLNALLLLHDL